jgi:tetratricopeptide (TPR) repeat protein
MLDTVSIVCPKCDQPTEISVSRATGGQTIATTSCRRCRAPFVAVTQEDQSVVLYESVDGNVSPLGLIRPSTGRSGYRVEPPDYLGIFDRSVPLGPLPTGQTDAELAGNVTALSGILHRPDGSPRPPADAARQVGWRAVWVAQLAEALRERLAAPPPLSFPPGVFISYRWGSSEENAWAARLAGTLRDRGYPVVFDRDESPEQAVPDLVSKIAGCRYFLALLDPGYLERIGRADDSSIKDGWVYDEYDTAVRLSNARQLRIVGLLRSGSELPRGFRLPSPGRQGNVIDVRDAADLGAVLDDVFPAIAGAPSAEVVEAARVLLAQSYEHICGGRYEDAFVAAQALTDLLPGLVDGPAQKLRVALQAGADTAAWQAAREALQLAPHSTELLRAAGLSAGGAGEPQEAVRYLGLVLEADDGASDDATLHLAIGSALDDLDQVHAALAHLEIARSAVPDAPSILNTLGYVYRRAGESRRAIDCLEAGLQGDQDDLNLLVNLAAARIECGDYEAAVEVLDRLGPAAPAGLREIAATDGSAPPSLVNVVTSAAQRWASCSDCLAHIPLGTDDTMCARCGSVVPMASGPCPSCTSDGQVVLIPGLAAQCPYCRHGVISTS